MKVAIFPASFNPITLGHLNLIQRAANICDKLYVLVANNHNKKYLFSAEQRFTMVSQAVAELKLDNVEVIISDKLTIGEYLRLNASYIVRGVRNYQDFEYEANLAMINQDLLLHTPGVEVQFETIYLASENHLKHISSSLIRELTFSKESFMQYAKNYLAPSTFRLCCTYLYE